jgi:hypothetical protein
MIFVRMSIITESENVLLKLALERKQPQLGRSQNSGCSNLIPELQIKVLHRSIIKFRICNINEYIPSYVGFTTKFAIIKFIGEQFSNNCHMAPFYSQLSGMKEIFHGVRDIKLTRMSSNINLKLTPSS